MRVGDRVALVAASGPLPLDVLAAGVAKLAGWGVHITVGAHARDRHPTLRYLAGTDADRAADLTRAWCDPDVDVVACARGGYGSVRLLELLDWSELAAVPPKPLLGSSDATALLHTFAAELGAPTMFGPMFATNAFATDTLAATRLHHCLFRPDEPVVVTGPDAGPLAAHTGGVAHGPTTGGNASLLAMIADLPPPRPRSILLLEDVNEDPYRLDAIITRLLRAGWLAEVAGIALGTWTGCGPPDEVRAMLTDRLAGLGVPVACGLTFGHCRGQATIPLAAPAVLDADAGTLTVLR